MERRVEEKRGEGREGKEEMLNAPIQWLIHQMLVLAGAGLELKLGIENSVLVSSVSGGDLST